MDRILIPRNTLVVLCGPAGCGKSTFASNNFSPTQIVSSDLCRAMVSDDPADQSISHHAFDLMHFIIEKRLMLGRLTAGDATHLDRDDRKPMIRMARYFRFNTAAIVFDIPLEICLARNRARARVVPEDAVRRQYGLLEETLRTITREGFNYVYVLGEEEQAQVKIGIGPPVRRRLARRPT